MTIRLFVAAAECGALSAQAELLLPPGAARHAQVRRVQPGDTLLLFDGLGSDWQAEILAVGRSEVRVRVLQAQAAAAELPLAVTLALGMPANERMDSVIEKAAELGAVRLQPLHTDARCCACLVNAPRKSAPIGRPWPRPPANSAAGPWCRWLNPCAICWTGCHPHPRTACACC